MQVITVAVLFAVLGVILGLLSPVTIPVTYARYTAVALLAALDSIFGAFKAYIAGTFESRVFFSGLITNMTLAGGLTYFGDKLGVDLSIAAIVAFNPERPVDQNLQEMRKAAGHVQTIEVTHAVRDSRSNGLRVKKGDVIALINDKLKHAGADYGSVVRAAPNPSARQASRKFWMAG